MKPDDGSKITRSTILASSQPNPLERSEMKCQTQQVLRIHPNPLRRVVMEKVPRQVQDLPKKLVKSISGGFAKPSRNNKRRRNLEADLRIGSWLFFVFTVIGLTILMIYANIIFEILKFMMWVISFS
jgi:hypothetical protein